MNNTLIIGISGKRETGKDTLAGLIRDFAKEAGYTVIRRGFGDRVKEEAAAALCDGGFSNILDLHATPEWRNQITKQLLQPVGGPTSASGIEFFLPEDYLRVLREMHDRDKKERYRLLMQWWGTEYRRAQDDKHWLRALKRWLDEVALTNSGQKLLFLIPDDRFPNEQRFLEDLGAFTIRIERPSVERGDEHPSEIALDGYKKFHMTILNDKDLDTLKIVAYQAWGAAQTYANGSAPL